MPQIVATRCFRRSDTKEMIKTGEPIYNSTLEYQKELVRVGLARECAYFALPTENKNENFIQTDCKPPSALHPVPVLPQTTVNLSEDGNSTTKKKPGRKKKQQ